MNFVRFIRFAGGATVRYWGPCSMSVSGKKKNSGNDVLLTKELPTCVEHFLPVSTPPKTSMEPENTPLEKEKHLPTTNFGVPAVSFRGFLTPS